MILVITMINYIDRGAISYAADSITREYGLGRVAWGQVLGFFGYGYMFGALAGGALADVWGTRRVWALAGFAWAFFEARPVQRFGARGLCRDTRTVRIFGGARLFGYQQDHVRLGGAQGAGDVRLGGAAEHATRRAHHGSGISGSPAADR